MNILAKTAMPALVTTEDVLKALGRYTRESNERDRRTAAVLGIKRATFESVAARWRSTSKAHPGAVSGLSETRRLFVMREN